MDTKNEKHPSKKKIGDFIHLVVTTMAAAIGVQSKRNLEKDFSQKSALPFIVAGILFTVIFLLTIMFVVSLVLTD